MISVDFVVVYIATLYDASAFLA